LTHAAIYDYRLEPGDIYCYIALTHAAIYDYRLEPGAIDIIIALTRRNYDYRPHLVISILLSPRTRRKFCDYFGTWWISLHIA
jgi:hypothetical protein